MKLYSQRGRGVKRPSENTDVSSLEATLQTREVLSGRVEKSIYLGKELKFYGYFI